MDSSFFTKNRENLTQKLDGQIFAVAAHKLQQRSADQDHDFFQDSNFYYLTGINEPECVLVIDKKGVSHLFIPEVTEFHTTWIGEGLSSAKAQLKSGIKHIYELNELSAVLPGLLGESVAMPVPDRKRSDGFRLNTSHQWLHKTLKRYKVKKIIDATPFLTELRMMKSKTEIALLGELATQTKDALGTCEKLIKAGTREYEVEAEITKQFRSKNAKHGYGPIVATGANACVLHYQSNDAVIKSGDCVLIDVGAEKNHYSADITRTYFAGVASKRQQAVHAAVSSLQKEIMTFIKPGKTMKDVELFTRERCLKYLQELNLLPSSATSKDTMRFLPHSFGHHLGLDVHDVADYGAPLEADMVITVEPGIYIRDESLGVRIEDDVVITKTGTRVL